MFSFKKSGGGFLLIPILTDAAWIQNLTNQLMCVAKHKSYQHLIALPVSLVAALDYKFSHISHCMDTSKCISASHFSDCLEYKFESHQSLPGHHQEYLQHCFSLAAWTTNLVTSVICLDAIKFTYTAALQWLRGLKFLTSVAALQWQFRAQI
ncbi:hypothetical protein TNCV_964791 [Trichonephila clavipes]|nr:hypothetical protein TNCV_1966981 [Trichonephila clavipes]GFU05297.1 hypothetical protein TNCV_964791 [Trichonephila clavipes]